MGYDVYKLVEWPECQYYMDCEGILRLLDSQDLMVPIEEYNRISEKEFGAFAKTITYNYVDS